MINQIEPKLEACPFCGEQPEISDNKAIPPIVLAKCNVCGTGWIVREHWNTRTAPKLEGDAIRASRSVSMGDFSMDACNNIAKFKLGEQTLKGGDVKMTLGDNVSPLTSPEIQSESRGDISSTIDAIAEKCASDCCDDILKKYGALPNSPAIVSPSHIIKLALTEATQPLQEELSKWKNIARLNKKHAREYELETISFKSQIAAKDERLKRLDYELQMLKDAVRLYEDGQKLNAIVLKMAEGAVTKLSESHSTAIELLAKAKGDLFRLIEHSGLLKHAHINQEAKITLTAIEQFLEKKK